MDTYNIQAKDFSHVCRTCLQSDKNLSPIFNSEAADMLNYCDFCVISETDGLPKQICFNCTQLLKQCYKFKQQCQNSFTVLTKLLMRNEESNLSLNKFLVNERKSSICFNRKESEACSVLSETGTNSVEQTENLLEESKCVNKESKESEKTSEDFISFLDKPLPPPLPFKCQKCDDSFSEGNDLKIHQSIHQNELVCLACLKKFTNRQILKRHLKIHLIKKPHVCKICSKSFSESYALTKHLRRHSGLPREKKHFCTICGQGFSEPYYLNVHLRKHTGERPLLCSVCQKTFADPRSLKIHAMIHSGEKPHKCNFCLKSFIQRANLTKHLRIHTGEKPYACKVCGKKFSQSSSLDKHHRTHNGDKKLYSCDKCFLKKIP